MPTVKDEQGNVIAKMPYDDAGEAAAEKMVEDSPNLEIDYGQNNVTDAPSMREQMYAGGGKTGYNAIGMYEKGGDVPEGIKQNVEEKRGLAEKMVDKLLDKEKEKRNIERAKSISSKVKKIAKKAEIFGILTPTGSLTKTVKTAEKAKAKKAGEKAKAVAKAKKDQGVITKEDSEYIMKSKKKK